MGRIALSQGMKRTFDILFSATLLLLALPALLLIAVAVRLSSSGPILFTQDRIGLNKDRFKIYKFRTMVQNAESQLPELQAKNETGGAAFKMKNDPRVTIVGRFLRRTSTDELPQLVNVLIGDMSLVGPRPLTSKDFEGLQGSRYDRRFSVKPGITCLYQISGRSLLSFDQWMLLDLSYVDQQSVWLDLSILARTFPAVLRGVGAV